MTGMIVEELIERLRELPPTAPVVAWSGHEQEYLPVCGARVETVSDLAGDVAVYRSEREGTVEAVILD